MMKRPGLKCRVCTHKFYARDRRPRIIPCGHTLCSKCVLDYIKEGELKCPTCHKEHIINDPADIPVNHALESFLLSDEEYHADPPTPSETPKSTVDTAKEVQELLVPLKQELRKREERTISKSRERSAHLRQYLALLEGWRKNHEDYAKKYFSIVNELDSMVTCIRTEYERVGTVIKKGEEQRQKMQLAEETLVAAKTQSEFIPALKEVTQCQNVVANWNQEANKNFPDTELITRSVRLREKTRSVLRVLSSAEGQAAAAAAQHVVEAAAAQAADAVTAA